MIRLTDEEREKFAAYLDQEAKTYEKLVEQLEELSGRLAASAIVGQVRAMRTVASWLVSWEKG